MFVPDAKFVKVVTNAMSSPDKSAFKEEQPFNIKLIFVTLLVSQLLTSNVVKDEQFANIANIFVTLLVSHSLTSNVVKSQQLKNIPDIFVTLLVSQELTSKLVIDKQFRNALIQSAGNTKVSSALTAVKLEQP